MAFKEALGAEEGEGEGQAFQAEETCLPNAVGPKMGANYVTRLRSPGIGKSGMI